MSANRSIFGGSTNISIAQGVTEYVFLGSGFLTPQATEAPSSRIIRATGTIDFLVLVLSTNSLSGNITVTLRQNGADTALTKTVAAGQIGPFFFQSTGIAVTAGDLIDAKIVTDAGTGTVIVRMLTVNFTPSSGCTALYGTDGLTTYTSASTTRFLGGAGNLISSLTEAQRAMTMDAAGTFRNMQAYIVSDTRTTTSTIKFRKNNADGTQVISIPGSQTAALLEDTTHTDHVSAGDTWNFSVTTGSSTGTLTLAFVSVEFDSDDGKTYCLYWMSTTGSTAANEYYGFIGGGPAASISYQTPVRQPLSLSSLRIYITTNTSSDNRNYRTNINGSSGNLAAAITAGATGIQSDVTHTDTLGFLDLLTVFLEGSASGSLTPAFGSMLVTVNTPIAQNVGAIF